MYPNCINWIERSNKIINQVTRTIIFHRTYPVYRISHWANWNSIIVLKTINYLKSVFFPRFDLNMNFVIPQSSSQLAISRKIMKPIFRKFLEFGLITVIFAWNFEFRDFRLKFFTVMHPLTFFYESSEFVPSKFRVIHHMINGGYEDN